MQHSRRAPARPRARKAVDNVVVDDLNHGIRTVRLILPIFKQKTGIDVRVIAKAPARRSIPAAAAMPTSSSCMPSRRGKTVAEGGGVKRFPVMYNDFVLVGPKSDPAGIKGKDIEPH